MSRGEKVLAGLMILILLGIAVLYLRQSSIKREQERLERQWMRNPLVEPNSTNTAPAK